MIYEVTLAVLTVAMVVWGWRRLKATSNYPNGPSGWPIIGNFFQIGPIIPLKLTEYSKTYGSVYSLKLLDKNVIVLNTYKALYEAMVERRTDFAGRPHNLTWDTLCGLKSIAFQDYSEALKIKRKLTMSGLRTFGTRKWAEIFTEEIGKLIESFTKGSPSGFNPHWPIHLTAFNSICRLAIGRTYTEDDPEFLAYMKMNNDEFKVMHGGNAVDYASWLRPFYNSRLEKLKEIAAVRTQFMDKKLKDHKTTLDRNKPRDLVDIVLIGKEDLKSNTKADIAVEDVFSDNDLVQFAMGVIAPGSDTVVAATKWFIIEMCVNPGVQENIHKELDKLVGPNRRPVYGDRESLPYLESAMYETMRLHTILPLAITHRTIRDTTVGGYSIPNDTHVISNHWALDHDADVFEDPFTFKADRYIDATTGSCVSYNAMHFAPFGMGQRVCVGEMLARMEYFLIVANLMYEFQFSLPKEKAKPKGVFGLSHIPESFEIIVRKRVI
ncbi:cytochrome P450 2U1-like [Glandiceps talaboti]